MSCDPRDSKGLAHHQLGNAMMEAGDLKRAEAAYTKAIEAREALVKSGVENREIINYLAGSYKSRAAVQLARVEIARAQGQSDPLLIMGHLQRAAPDIKESVRLRAKLFEDEATIQVAHDFAMTLYLRAEICGKLDQKTACNDLEIAISLLEELAPHVASYRTDLACCRADLVLYRLPLTPRNNGRDLLRLTDRANSELAEILDSNATLRIKYLDFLSNAAAPAAFHAGVPKKAVHYISLGLRRLDEWADSCDPRFAKRALMFFNNVPAQMLPALGKEGLDLGWYHEILAKLMAVIAKAEKAALAAAKTIAAKARDLYAKRGEHKKAAAVQRWIDSL